jgi:aspartyl/asparaginyl beta-hydroxylase (cupin superfamily)
MSEPSRPALRIADPSAARLNSEAMQAMSGGRLDEAKRLLEESLRRDSAFLPAWINQAALQRAGGDIPGALSSVENALKLDPLCFPALLMRGSLFDAQGKIRDAAAAYGIALTRMPPADQLDEATRRACARAREVNDRFAAELGDWLDRSIRPEIGRGAAAPTRRMNQFLDHLSGNRRPYHQKPTNFFYPGLPSIEFWDRDAFPWLEMVEAATDDIRGELLNVANSPSLEPYMQRDPTQPVQQWGELNHSLRWSAYHFALMGKPYPEHRRECPKTAAILDQVPFPSIPHRSPASLFSILQPRTHIPAHNGAGNVRLLCHLPLVLPPDCRFRVGNESREWKMGEALVFDDTIEHEAWNNSDQMRAVLIFDIWNPLLTPEERDFISRALAGMDDFTREG